MSELALRARAVYPVAAPAIEDAVVVIAAGRITSIGRTVPRGAEVLDLGDSVITPGFVNAHTHLEFSSQRRPLGRKGTPLPDWIRRAIEKRPATGQVGKAIRTGLEESIAAGVTTVVDICRHDPEDYVVDPPTPRMVLLQESIGFSQARAASALAAVEKRMETFERFVASMNGSSIRLGVSPHAPYSTSPQLIRELVSLAAKLGQPVAMHLAESTEEIELLTDGRGPFQQLLEERSMWDPWVIPRGSSPLDYLRMLTLAPRSLVVHGNYLNHTELALMGRHKGAMSLVYCPRTHARFKHPDYPLAEALALNVRVCVGTDSRASNPDLCILSEMREVAAKHPQVGHDDILRMGTLSGAEAVGMADEIGSIRPGMLADLNCIPLTAGAQGRPDELLASILHGEQPVAQSWLGGDLIVHHPM